MAPERELDRIRRRSLSRSIQRHLLTGAQSRFCLARGAALNVIDSRGTLVPPSLHYHATTMEATTRTILAFEFAVRLLHDYPWHPPPTLTLTHARLGVGIAARYAAVEMLFLRPLCIVAVLFFPGVRSLLDKIFPAWRDGSVAEYAVVLLFGATLLAISDVLTCGWRAYQASEVLAPRRLAQLQRRFAVTCCLANADGLWEGTSTVLLSLASTLVRQVAGLALTFWACSTFVFRRPMAAWEVGANALFYTWVVTAIWSARGLALLMQHVLPPPLAPSA